VQAWALKAATFSVFLVTVGAASGNAQGPPPARTEARSPLSEISSWFSRVTGTDVSQQQKSSPPAKLLTPLPRPRPTELTSVPVAPDTEPLKPMAVPVPSNQESPELTTATVPSRQEPSELTTLSAPPNKEPPELTTSTIQPNNEPSELTTLPVPPTAVPVVPKKKPTPPVLIND
jgi:hypothetical protein